MTGIRFLFILLMTCSLGCEKDQPPTCGELTVMNNKFYKGESTSIINGEFISMTSTFYNHYIEGYFFNLNIFTVDTCTVGHNFVLELKSFDLPDTLFLKDYEPFYSSLSVQDYDATIGVYYLLLENENWISITEINSDTTEIKGTYSFSLFKDSGNSQLVDTMNFREGVFTSEFLEL